MSKHKRTIIATSPANAGYADVLSAMVELINAARRTSARAVNAVMTETYWEIGRRIVELEQRGERRAEYGAEVLQRLSADLKERFGRGFGLINLRQMRRFYLLWPPERIRQTASDEFVQMASSRVPRIGQTLSDQSIPQIAARFNLPWSHYVKLQTVENEQARNFYEDESLRGGWSVRQLDRQISSQFFERTLLSKDKAAMLRQGAKAPPSDLVTPEAEIKDPLVLEFLDLKDEYSEHELEEALIHKLETFLLELGGDFAFIGRQRRLRIGHEWYRIDLLFFHRTLRCLVVIDLKIGRFTHADAGQMHMYLNYAREHWKHEGENPPVGLILCAENDEAVAKYSLEGLPNKVMAAEYKLALPKEAVLVAELEKTKKLLEHKNAPRDTKAIRIGRERTPKKKSARRKKN